MAKTRAQENRAIRQDALREQLAAKGLVQKVLDNIDKMEELKVVITEDGSSLCGQFELNKLKTANDQRLKLVNKYLPDLKSAEITGEGGAPIEVASTFEFIPVDSNA